MNTHEQAHFDKVKQGQTTINFHSWPILSWSVPDYPSDYQ